MQGYAAGRKQRTAVAIVVATHAQVPAQFFAAAGPRYAVARLARVCHASRDFFDQPATLGRRVRLGTYARCIARATMVDVNIAALAVTKVLVDAQI
jgi:hypothetical protein